MALADKGVFSYQAKDVNFMEIGGGLSARIEPVNSNVARLFLVDKRG